MIIRETFDQRRRISWYLSCRIQIMISDFINQHLACTSHKIASITGSSLCKIPELQIQLVAKFYSSEVQDIVWLYTNAYFAYPELLLMALLASDDRGERVLAVATVTQQIRGGGDSGTCLSRNFVPSALNIQRR